MPIIQAIPTKKTPPTPPPSIAGAGLVRLVSPEQRVTLDRVQKEKREAEKEQSKQPVTNLAAYIRRAWEAAVIAKDAGGVTNELLKCLRQRNGIYEDSVKNEIAKTQGSDIYMMLTSMKCRAAEAWIKDIMLPVGDKPWSLTPSENPDLPDNVKAKIAEQVTIEAATIMRETGVESVSTDQIRDRLEEINEEVRKERLAKAKLGCKRMERYIQDQLVMGGYYEAISKFVTDLVTYPAAFIKGPIIRRKKHLAWGEDEDGQPIPQVVETPVRTYERVSPFDIYPSPGARSLDDGYLCERIKVRRAALESMIGSPGWNEGAIRGVLDDNAAGMASGSIGTTFTRDHERAVAEGRSQEYQDPDPPLKGVMFCGPVQGKLLREWGLDSKQVPDPLKDYEIKAVMFGRWVVMARVNPHPLGHRGYYSAAFEETNDGIWHKSPPQLMRDTQRICNAVARALVNNVGIASGPQVEVFMDRLLEGEDPSGMWPWKIWKTKEGRAQTPRPAVNFWQPSMLADVLLNVYEFFFKQASEQSGIPAYMYGNERIGGAGSTASGLSMLLNAASKTLKGVVSHIDANVIKPSIYNHWVDVMLNDIDIDKYGDIDVVARASEYLIVEEQLQLRRSEFLKDTMNPIDAEIIGKTGRAAVLREQAKGLKLPSEDIVPSKAQLEEEKKAQEAAMGAQSEGGPGAPAGAQQSLPVAAITPPAPAQQGAVMSPEGGRMGKPPVVRQ